MYIHIYMYMSAAGNLDPWLGLARASECGTRTKRALIGGGGLIGDLVTVILRSSKSP